VVAQEAVQDSSSLLVDRADCAPVIEGPDKSMWEHMYTDADIVDENGGWEFIWDDAIGPSNGTL